MPLWLILLCLLPSAPTELVQAAYRVLAQKAHPDHGGDTAAMATINTAMEALRPHLQSNRKD